MYTFISWSWHQCILLYLGHGTNAYFHILVTAPVYTFISWSRCHCILSYPGHGTNVYFHILVTPPIDNFLTRYGRHQYKKHIQKALISFFHHCTSASSLQNQANPHTPSSFNLINFALRGFCRPLKQRGLLYT